jgi:hypothetical protein
VPGTLPPYARLLQHPDGSFRNTTKAGDYAHDSCTPVKGESLDDVRNSNRLIGKLIGRRIMSQVGLIVYYPARSANTHFCTGRRHLATGQAHQRVGDAGQPDDGTECPGQASVGPPPRRHAEVSPHVCDVLINLEAPRHGLSWLRDL